MKPHLSKLLPLFLVTFSINLVAVASVAPSGRYVFILYPGVDAVHGSSMFLIHNSDKVAKTAIVPILLPEETIDWKIGHGITESEVTLGKEGGIFIKKEFAPGDNLISLSLRVAARLGSATLTFKPKNTLTQLALYLAHDGMVFDRYSLGFELATGVPFAGQIYNTLTRHNVIKGEEVKVSLNRIAEGRQRFWIMGLVAALGLVVMGGISAVVFSRPRYAQDKELIQ